MTYEVSVHQGLASQNIPENPQAVVTNVVIWSQVEAGVAVIAACLPTLRPLFLKGSIDSLIGSIRSVLSLNSLPCLQSAERRGSGNEALTDGNGLDLGAVRAAESKNSDLEAQVIGKFNEHDETPPLPTDRIMMHDGIAFKEEHPERV